MRKLGLTSLTLIGLGLGIAVGLFFGEYAKVLQPIGDGFVMLLQMAVLPYFVVTLILGLGSITLGEAKLLGVNGIKVLAMLWGGVPVDGLPAAADLSGARGRSLLQHQRRTAA